ncbi:ABC transporter ATP-binding protein [Pedobacter puniceum]|uniref:Putative hemin import ATP-binding protein HrtA n=1 Tax=Pedobacter puniceum TaxID=2666136 RepID=A0A7K0FQU7_9SPHI|nr:ABC transporter ATP-binding protein [Pedobacter puniceum]MRX48346.1 ATP-binding cassette domain-containing protein [Pedobacter puniceum]
MITLSGITYSYPNIKSINFKDLTIKSDENWLVLGNSGSGKTTLLNILTGLLKPSSGTVIINQQDVYQLNGNDLDKWRAKNLGIVFQKSYLIPSLTVSENLLVAQKFAKLKEDKRRILEVLEQLQIIDKLNHYPKQLSVGQLQRVSIARAVLNKPKYIIADEPTSSLDDENAEAVLNLFIKQAAVNHAGLIIATHDKRVKDCFQNTYQI